MRRCMVPAGSNAARWRLAGARWCSTPGLDGYSKRKYAEKGGREPLDPIVILEREPDGGSYPSNAEAAQHTRTHNPALNGASITPDAPPTRARFSSPRERRPLPISPLMDPAFLAARAKHKARKAPPTQGDPGSLQARLAKNPYALALATPVRKCQLTEAMLPKFFLQDFNMMAHPKTGQPWYMPTSLTAKPSSNEILKTSCTNNPGDDDPAPTDLGSMTKEDTEETHSQGKRIGFNVYTLASKQAIDHLQDMKGRFSTAAFLPNRYRRISNAMRIVENAGWRQDMGIFMAKLWRRRIAENMGYLMNIKRSGKNVYFVEAQDWEDAKKKAQPGAFLWLGEKTEGEPKQWATLDVPTGHERFGETKKVPVYNLREMLGSEILANLRSGVNGEVLRGNIIVVKDKKVTLGLRMKLWKFQGYLSVPEPEEFDEDEELDEDMEDAEEEYEDYPDVDEDVEPLKQVTGHVDSPYHKSHGQPFRDGRSRERWEDRDRKNQQPSRSEGEGPNEHANKRRREIEQRPSRDNSISDQSQNEYSPRGDQPQRSQYSRKGWTPEGSRDGTHQDHQSSRRPLENGSRREQYP